MLGEDRYDAGVTERYSKKTMIASFVLIFGSLFGLCYVSKYIPVFQPVVSSEQFLNHFYISLGLSRTFNLDIFFRLKNSFHGKAGLIIHLKKTVDA